MKPQNLYVGMAPSHDMIVRAVQEVCKAECTKKLMERGSWEFSITQHALTRWWCCYIHGEFEVTQEILCTPEWDELKNRLEELVDKERFTDEEREAFSGEDTGLSEEA